MPVIMNVQCFFKQDLSLIRYYTMCTKSEVHTKYLYVNLIMQTVRMPSANTNLTNDN